MDEQRIRQIVQQEIGALRARDVFSINQVPQHIHSGLSGDAPNIPANNIIPIAAGGSRIDMETSDVIYRIQVTSIPRMVFFHGVATDGATSYRAIVNGTAVFSPCYMFINAGNRTVIPETVSANSNQVNRSVIQGCSSLTVAKSGTVNEAYAWVSEYNLCEVVVGASSPSNLRAEAWITDFTEGYIDVYVRLYSGWSITGYWTVI